MFFAYAAQTDLSQSATTNLVFIILAIIFATLLLAILPILLSRWRRQRHSETLFVATLFWTILTIGLAIHAAMTQLQWSDKRRSLLNSGYYDPADTSPAPHQPWLYYSLLAIFYIALLLCSLLQSTPPPPKP